MLKTYSGLIKKLEPHQIYVFGSNTQGRHGKGAALLAHKYFGAIYGVAYGLQGQCFAICTKDLTKSVHPSISTESIISEIGGLYMHASIFSEQEFLIAYTLSTNLNGYTTQEMANMFALAGPIPNNIVFNEEFAKLIDTSLWAS
jgi:hypothetical protein